MRSKANIRSWTTCIIFWTVNWWRAHSIYNVEMVFVLFSRSATSTNVYKGFYINLPIGGLVAGILFLIHIPDRTTKPSTKRTFTSTYETLDISGFMILAPTTAMLLLAIEWGGNTYPWHSAKIIGLLCGSAATCVLFVAWESKRGSTAMIPLPMARNRIVAASCITNFFFMGAMLITAFYGDILSSRERKYTNGKRYPFLAFNSKPNGLRSCSCWTEYVYPAFNLNSTDDLQLHDLDTTYPLPWVVGSCSPLAQDCSAF